MLCWVKSQNVKKSFDSVSFLLIVLLQIPISSMSCMYSRLTKLCSPTSQGVTFSEPFRFIHNKTFWYNFNFNWNFNCRTYSTPCISCTAQLHTLYCTLHTLYCTLLTLYCTLHTLYCALQCTQYTTHYPTQTAHSTVSTVKYSEYTAQWKLYLVSCTQ